ncbi:DUF1835 domain-containing protein [Litoribacillus peritrichatus]|uniref:DUF1835 domain-containing protein n=1 Tax=Litoribacillus peritrichatus TaxID=718191 RepID=A0ABP7N4H4_9GAMM
MTDLSPRVNTPFRINLEQQKKRAKALLKDIHASDESGIARLHRNHPQYSKNNHAKPAETAKLSDAQFVIARELGLPSWPKLKAHVEAMQCAVKTINSKNKPQDSDLKTLHIRCGTDLQNTLPLAGFVGDFLEYSDPVCQGPVPNDPSLIDVRVDYLTSAYGPYIQQSRNQILEDLTSEENRLETAAQTYERVVLWFEHDTYDQLILARILAHFAENQRPNVFEIVSINHFPGSERFIGLGQLPPEAIWLLWNDRKPVSQQQLNLGQRTWNAFQSPNPTALANIRLEDTSVLPNLANAIQRHLQELPSTANGLSLTEQIILEMLKEESRTAGKLFGLLTREREPLPWLGDIMFWYILESLAKSSNPAVRISTDQPKTEWPHRQVEITNTGLALLAKESDWLTMNPPERWLGGVHIDPQSSCWRWDQAPEKLILK